MDTGYQSTEEELIDYNETLIALLCSEDYPLALEIIDSQDLGLEAHIVVAAKKLGYKKYDFLYKWRHWILCKRQETDEPVFYTYGRLTNFIHDNVWGASL